jgi:hypothetical protein
MNSVQSSAALPALLATLRGPKPERDLVEVLHAHGAVGAAVLAPWGELLAGTSGGAVRAEVRDEGRLLGTLTADRAPEGLLDLAAEVYAVAALRREARTVGVSAAREVLLAELLSGSRAPDLPERLGPLGLTGESVAVAVLELPDRRARTRAAQQALHDLHERLRAAGDTLLAARGHRWLSAVRGGRVVWLWTTLNPEALTRALMAALGAVTSEDLRLGVSDVTPDARQGDRALTQAILAASMATRGQAAHFSTLDPLHWVLSAQPEEQLACWRDTLLAPLIAGDEDGKLMETLRAFLHDPSHRGALAERLGVHPNTLRYRLGRIEDLLGRPLAHPATLARLYLALGLTT